MSNYVKILTNQSLNGSFTSAPQPLLQASLYSIQCAATGTAVSGTISLESSTNLINLPDPINQAASANWDTISGASAILAASGSVTFNLNNQSYPYFRVRWANTNSSSNALVNITSYLKG